MDTKYAAEQHKFAAAKLSRQVENAILDLKAEDRFRANIWTVNDVFARRCGSGHLIAPGAASCYQPECHTKTSELGKRSYLVQLGTPGYEVRPAIHPRDRVFNLIMSGLNVYCLRSIDDLSIPRYVSGLHNELEKLQYNDGVLQDFLVGWLGDNDYRVEVRAIGVLHSWRISFRTDGVLVSEERPQKL
jgi:hypothetical protein